jgi:hypothetical protein
MFKAHVLVSEQTNVADEIASLVHLARKSGLCDAAAATLAEAVGSVVSELKQTSSEAAASGIMMDVRKVVATEDYEIVLELKARTVAKTKRRHPLARLFGR